MNFRHLLGCDTIVFENTRSGLSKTCNEKNNSNLARHAKVHSSYKSVCEVKAPVKPRTYSSHVLGCSFMSLDKLPIQPIRFLFLTVKLSFTDTECIGFHELIYISIYV